MAYAIVMCFDPETERKIRTVWEKLAGGGVNFSPLNSGWRPHISLAVFDRLDVADAKAKLELFSSGISSFRLMLSNLGVFAGEESVLFLSPVVNERLLRTHRDLHRLFEDYADAEWEYYLEERWVPHCTLAERLPRSIVPKAAEIACEISLPINALAEDIALVEFRPVKELCAFKLR